jgi:hypothetical protein
VNFNCYIFLSCFIFLIASFAHSVVRLSWRLLQRMLLTILTMPWSCGLGMRRIRKTIHSLCYGNSSIVCLHCQFIDSAVFSRLDAAGQVVSGHPANKLCPAFHNVDFDIVDQMREIMLEYDTDSWGWDTPGGLSTRFRRKSANIHERSFDLWWTIFRY